MKTSTQQRWFNFSNPGRQWQWKHSLTHTAWWWWRLQKKSSDGLPRLLSVLLDEAGISQVVWWFSLRLLINQNHCLIMKKPCNNEWSEDWHHAWIQQVPLTQIIETRARACRASRLLRDVAWVGADDAMFEVTKNIFYFVKVFSVRLHS